MRTRSRRRRAGSRGFLLLAVLLCGALAACTPAGAASGAPRSSTAAPRSGTRHAVGGRITAESGSTWTVLTAENQTDTVRLTPATRYGRSHQPATAAAFPVGAEVRVLGTVTGTTITARRVLPPLSSRPGQTPTSTATPTPSPAAPPVTAAPAPVPASPAAADATATTAVAAADARVGAHAGTTASIAVMDQADGVVADGSSGSTPLESASVVKLFTIVDLLHRSETGQIQLSPQDMTDIGRALSLSDDDAMDDLWESYGGTQTISDVVSLAGLQDTAPPSDPDEWGETTMSARDVLAVYRYAFTRLTPADQQTIRTGLLDAGDSGADGFDQAFGLLNPPRPAGTMAKQGWMSDGEDFLHTTGVPGAGSPYVVAVLTRQPGGDSWDTARSTVDDVSGALTRTLAAPAA